MKKFLLSIFVAALSIGAVANNEKTMSVVISPLALSMLSFDARLALKLHDRIALTLPVVVQVFPKNEFTQEDLMYVSGGVGAQFFLSDTAFENGFYLEPRVVVGWSQMTPNPKHSIRAFSSPFLRTQLMVGHGWVWGSGFTMNAGIGGYYNRAFGDEAMAIKKVLVGTGLGAANILTSMWGLTSGFGPTAEFSIGYSW
jgi:hypothetical protein